jgi:hypothetical protein
MANATVEVPAAAVEGDVPAAAAVEAAASATGKKKKRCKWRVGEESAIVLRSANVYLTISCADALQGSLLRVILA